MKMESEIEMIHLQAKEHQVLMAVTKNWKKQGRTLPWSLWNEPGPADTLNSDFWLPEI